MEIKRDRTNERTRHLYTLGFVGLFDPICGLLSVARNPEMKVSMFPNWGDSFVTGEQSKQLVELTQRIDVRDLAELLTSKRLSIKKL
jgi:hypothetical protein